LSAPTHPFVSWQILPGDCRAVLQSLPPAHFHTCVTSPPYFGLRDYGHDGQIGLEQTPEAFVAELVAVFREVRRVLRDDGTLWLNLGDSYARTGGTDRKVPETAKVGSTRNTLEQMSDRTSRAASIGLKDKDLIGIPWRVAFALQADGWYLRQDIIWHKPNPMPESVRDRCTKAHEYIFLLSKSPRYYFDSEAMAEPAASGTRNRRSVWTVATRPFKGAHFATFPPDLIEPCILAGAPAGGHVLDPFNGAGTTGLVSIQHGRTYTGIELNPDYIALATERLASVHPQLPLSA
jgi:DNA modification methylase